MQSSCDQQLVNFAHVRHWAAKNSQRQLGLCSRTLFERYLILVLVCVSRVQGISRFCVSSVQARSVSRVQTALLKTHRLGSPAGGGDPGLASSPAPAPPDPHTGETPAAQIPAVGLSSVKTLDRPRQDAIRRVTYEKAAMTIITIASSKGGPGKTTLAQLIVGTLAGEGVSVAALDADPTGGLSRWASRLYEGPPFACHHEAEDARLAHLIHRVAQEVEVVVVDTAGFGNRAATVAMTAADAVLIPMVPGEADVTEAARTLELVAGVSAAARREIPARVVLNRVRSATALSKHALAEAASLPKLEASLSDLVAYGEMGFSGRMPVGKAGLELVVLISELRGLGWLPDASVKSKDVKTPGAGNPRAVP